MMTNFYWSIVTDNEDPDDLYRVRVSKECDKIGTPEWLPVITPFAADNVRASFIPKIGELVKVIYLDKKGESKAVMGSKWLNVVLPPETEENTDDKTSHRLCIEAEEISITTEGHINILSEDEKMTSETPTTITSCTQIKADKDNKTNGRSISLD